MGGGGGTKVCLISALHRGYGDWCMDEATDRDTGVGLANSSAQHVHVACMTLVKPDRHLSNKAMSKTAYVCIFITCRCLLDC